MKNPVFINGSCLCLFRERFWRRTLILVLSIMCSVDALAVTYQCVLQRSDGFTPVVVLGSFNFNTIHECGSGLQVKTDGEVVWVNITNVPHKTYEHKSYYCDIGKIDKEGLFEPLGGVDIPESDPNFSYKVFLTDNIQLEIHCGS